MFLVAPICVASAFLCSEATLAIQRRAARTDSVATHDAGSLRLLWITISASITLAFVMWPDGPALPAGIPWKWVGVTVFITGSALRRWAIWQLGRFFTVNVAVAADHRVVETGPFRWVRHPSYLGLLLQLAGLGITFSSLAALLLTTILPTLAILRRIAIEETTLRAQLPAYAAYEQRTRQRLIPLIY